MAKRGVHEFVVAVEIPDGVTTGDMVDYIREAVGCWAKTADPGGNDDPGDRLFNLDTESVRVRHVVKRAKPRKGG